MRDLPIASVITPFYNPAPAFLSQAIESVLRQTFTDWELLLVDDGSTNESSALARDYAQQFPNQIHYLEHPSHANRGKSTARNLALRCAAGRYLAFLDADDVWLPPTLGAQVALLEAHPEAALVYGNTEYWFSWTENPEDVHRDFRPALGVPPDTLIQPPALVPLFLDGRAAVPCPCSLLVRRQAVEEHGATFEDAFESLYEDQVFYFKLCLRFPVFVTDQTWGRYRQHPEASTWQAVRNGQDQIERMVFLDWLERYLGETQITDREVWQALRRQKWLDRTSALPRRAARTYRWAKKWILRTERRWLPPIVRRWLWAKDLGHG